MAITDESTSTADDLSVVTQKIAFCTPVLPGLEDAHRQDMAAASGDRREQHTESRRRAGITLERAWHQETPDGTLAIVYIEAADLEKVFGVMATSEDPYDVDFRESVQRIHGIDLTGEFPFPDLLLDWTAPGTAGTAAPMLGYAAPILPGKEGADRSYYEAITGDRHDDFVASQRAAGITSQAAFHQPTPAGPVAVGVMAAADLEGAIEYLATSDDPMANYFRDTVREVHGMDFEDGFLLPEPLLDWSV